jgi:hypothetical protein
MPDAAVTDESADEALITGKSSPEDAAETGAAREAAALADPSDATLPARHQYDRTQVEVIKQTVAKDLTPAEMAWFLEVSARYGLDPLLKEIFAAKFSGSNGPVAIFTGRDGYLKAAKHGGKFVRMTSHVVREKDEFVKMIDTAASEEEGREILTIRHVAEGFGTEKRGKIVGAYAMVWTTASKHPWYADAPWEEFGEKRQAPGGKPGTWTLDNDKGYPEQMMVKVPESIALRKACGLSGLYAEEELAQQIAAANERPALSSAGGAAPTVEYPEDERGQLIEAMVNRANELVPGAFRAAKVRLELGTGDDERLDAFTERLRKFIAQREPNDPLVVVETVAVDESEVEQPEDGEHEDGEQAEGESPTGDITTTADRLKSAVADIEAQLDDPDLSPEDRRKAEAELVQLNGELEAEEADGGA